MKARQAGKLARFLAWMLALMLVPLVTGTLFGWTALRLATDQRLHERVAMRDAVISGQMEQIEQEAERLGEAYGFDGRMVTEALNLDTVMELNRQVVAWWTRMCSTGMPEDMPLWDGETLREALLENEDFVEKHGVMSRDAAGKIVSALNSMLGRLLFPMREILITEGLEMIRRRVALGEMIDLAQGLPLTLTLLSLAIAGMMLLLTAGDWRTTQKQMGSALGGAGLLSLFTLGMIWKLNLEGMIRESSSRLAEQVHSLQIMMSVEMMGVILVLLGCGWLMLKRSGKTMARAGGEPA